ncbi:MAG: YHS domain-containing (seleno)protein [Flavobacterium sp.]|uniref:YHS domain-containing (seleno)protein n=1 Tax=Flavobacterium sp. TaxID=239 RepID=UPI00260FBF28|nr:YHS domain-containing (seleno)protein [Flavobacterium sp.]MDD5151979.1 YHS domain-containing (seleno)protein [Flavobacterium sp.]
MKNLKSIVLVAFVALISNIVSAQVEPVDKNKLAIGGYDVVSYFTPGKATKGEGKFEVEYNGANYYFASAKNQKTFKANPEKYLPQCNGYCAWGIAADKGNFPINPLTYKIVDGKLYLFFNGLYEGKQFNTLTEWNKDEKNYLKKLAVASEKTSKK